MIKKFLSFYLLFFAPNLFATANTLGSTAGILDPTFGSGGIAVAPLGVFSTVNGVAIQADGKIVGAGVVNGGLFDQFTLLRLNRDGSLDTSYVNNGFNVFSLTPVIQNSAANDIKIDFTVTPNKRVAVGYTFIEGNTRAIFGLVREDDTSLNYIVLTDVTPGQNSIANKLAIQPDGKYVAAGFVGTVSDGTNIALVRYNSNGTLDTSFGSGGKVITSLSTGNDQALAIATGPQVDNKIVIVGFANNNNQFAVVRYNPDGSLDTTFGIGGKVVFGAAPVNVFTGVALQSDGKIVAVGRTNATPNGVTNFAIYRFNFDGTLDLSFGLEGSVIINVGTGGNSEASSVVIQPNGQIVVAGSANGDYAVIRLNSDGSLDPLFGNNGIATSPIAGNSQAFGVGIQNDGAIVLAGFSTLTGTSQFTFARYIANPGAKFLNGVSSAIATKYGKVNLGILLGVRFP